MNERGDIIDQGNETAELFNRAALSQRKPTGPEATGECLNCGETLADSRRWCDHECRNDWELRQHMKGIAGSDE